MTNIPLIILLEPDTYITIGWAVMAALTLLVAPLAAWLWLRRKWRWRQLWLVMPLALLWYVFLYGTYVGFGSVEVVRVEYASADLPKEFDGYRIVQVSDLHLGTLTGRREKIFQRVVDSINAQHADAVVFTGDLQNIKPDEILPFREAMNRIKAHDGVYSVLGNHDYTMYLDTNDAIELGRNQGNTEGYQFDAGWILLKNDKRRIRRDSASIVIAGMENDGEGRFPQNGDLSAALWRVRRSDFVIMLEHDPTAWRRKILPHSHTQLTLSGHTHGGQFAIFGWSPASFIYKETHGMYYAGERAMYVSSGVGGLIPFRFGMPGEIVVITLRSKK